MNKGVLVIVILIVLFCGGFIVFTVLNNNEEDKNDINTEIIENNRTDNETDTNTSNEIANNNADNDISEINNESANQNEINNEYDDGTFRVREIDNESFNSSYKIIEEEEVAKNSVSIEEKDNNLTIAILKTNLNESLLENGSAITYDTKYDISNINADEVDTIFYGMEGQDWDYPLIFILQKDGTVKGIDMENGYKTGEFIAKNISELKNVDRFEQVDVTPQNNSGYYAVVAITKDNLVYEVGVN